MSILIVEDETRTAADLKETIQRLRPGAKIPAVLDTIESTQDFLLQNPSPELIFMDIQLADGLSFDIFKNVEVKCPVIFCTAFDDYFMEAFKANGIEYILKPFDEENISKALSKAEKLKDFYTNGQNLTKQIENVAKNLQPAYKTTFLVNYRDKLFPVGIQEISYFFIEHELTFIYANDGKRFVINNTLDELEETLDPAQFFRANRQYLINYEFVHEVEHHFARKLLVKLKTQTKEPVIVSKAKSTTFLKWLEQR